MKKLLLGLVITMAAIPLNAQFFESFNDGLLPANWDLAQGIQVSAYSDPQANCVFWFAYTRCGWKQPIQNFNPTYYIQQ
jgi:hypothetical protein